MQSQLSDAPKGNTSYRKPFYRAPFQPVWARRRGRGHARVSLPPRFHNVIYLSVCRRLLCDLYVSPASNRLSNSGSAERSFSRPAAGFATIKLWRSSVLIWRPNALTRRECALTSLTNLAPRLLPRGRSRQDRSVESNSCCYAPSLHPI